MNRAQRRHAPAPAAGSKRTTLIYVTIAVVVVGIIVGVGFASRVPKVASTAPTYANIKVGDPAPPFTAATTAGPFDSTKAGKPIFLEVFATWCPHCQEEAAVIDDLYAAYKDKVDFVGVSGSEYGMDQSTPESQNDVYQFTQKFNVKYPVAYDSDLTVAKKYLQGGFPTMVIIGKDGKIIDVETGSQPKATLKAKLDQAVK